MQFRIGMIFSYQHMKTKLNNEKNPDAVSLQRETLAGIQDFNNVLTSSQAVHPIFQGHYFSMETGENGIVSLIKQILNENAAVMVAGIETSPLRNIAIGLQCSPMKFFKRYNPNFPPAPLVTPWRQSGTTCQR